MSKTYRPHFKLVGNNFFTKTYFEVTAHCNSRFTMKNPNILSRLQNAIVTGLNKEKTLPKYIIIVLKADLIEYLHYADASISTMYGIWLEWLAKNFNEAIMNKKQLMPRKAVRDGEPFIYWALLPYHKNFEGSSNICRSKFNNCMESIVNLYPNMRLLHLKQWDPSNTNLVVNGRMTFYGFAEYWRALDSAVDYNV